MCRLTAAEFDAELWSPADARHWVVEQLLQWDLGSLVDPCRLLASELVANAVVHASSRPKVTISVAGGVLEVGVSDREPRLPRPRPGRSGGHRVLGDAAPASEYGRGLLMVDAIADEWGATSLATGKHVWFRLDVADWVHRAACRCGQGDAREVPLESGRHVVDLLGGPPGPT